MGKISFHFHSILLFSLFINCSIFQMNKYNGFGEWYFGRPGLLNTYEIINPEDKCISEGTDVLVRVEEERHPLFLHFRLPETIINPQAGFYFPKVSRDCFVLNERGEKGGLEYETKLDRKSKPGSGMKSTITFGGFTGITDTMIPYRLYTAKDVDSKDAFLFSLIAPLAGFMNYALILYIEIPVYFVHDVLKTATIPFAGIYYLNQNKNTEEKRIEDNSDYSKFKHYNEFLKTHKK